MLYCCVLHSCCLGCCTAGGNNVLLGVPRETVFLEGRSTGIAAMGQEKTYRGCSHGYLVFSGCLDDNLGLPAVSASCPYGYESMPINYRWQLL